jgi:predicted Zn-dependent protease
MSRRRALSRFLSLAPIAVACATVDVEPIRDSAFAPDDDEQKLWQQAQELDGGLEEAKQLLRDPELEAYLEGVSKRLLAPMGPAAPAVRVRVLLNPHANAFAFPNGSLYLHSGLLAPMQSEAQLATVLGHEITHYVARHSLREARAQQNRETARKVAVGVVAVLAAAGGDPYAAMTLAQGSSEFAQTIIRAQVAGYSRDLEREADQRSIEMLIASGYEPSEALRVFERLREDVEASDQGGPYAYASHPHIEERIASVKELLAKRPPGAAPGHVGDAEFQERTAGVLVANAELELASGAVVPAQNNLERYLALRPNDVKALRLLAEACRRLGPEPENVARAASALERAAALAPDEAGVQRELGLLYRELADRERASRSLRRYVELAPDAPDRPIVERYLAELQ